MTTEELLALAERCEKEAAGSRELDAAIAGALGWKRGPMVDAQGWRDWVSPQGKSQVVLPLWSTSLDAARKLGGMVVFASDIGADGLSMVKLVSDTTTSPIIEHTGIAATLELAWCAAALRALAATE